MPDAYVTAFDLGTETGITRLHGGKIATYRLSMKGRDRGDAYLYFFTSIDQFIALSDCVFYEVPHHRGGASTSLLLGLQALLETRCHMAGVPCVGIHSATVKKQSTGSGRAEKKDMMEFARGYALKKDMTQDEADSVCVLAAAKKLHPQFFTS